MKVLNVIYNKGQGGLENMYLKYSQMLTDTGNEVICMLPYNGMIEEKVCELDVHIIKNKDISNSISHINPLSVHRVKKIVRDIKPDIILVHNSRSLKLLNKAANNICPVVVVHHGGSASRLLGNADNIICVSKHITNELDKLSPQCKHIHHIPNSIDVRKQYSKRVLNNKSDERLTIGVMARLTPEKGVDILLDALKHVDIPYKALIAGDGEMENDLKRAVQDNDLNVEFLGWLHNKDKEDFFKKCDVIVVPSRSEHFGLVILEAWMHSVPVVSSKTNGGIELIDDGINGHLVDLEDAKGLAEAIVKVTRPSHDVTKNAYDNLIKDYSSSGAVKKLVQTLDDIINIDYKPCVQKNSQR